MSEKSRVILYKPLRDKIEQMDVYSFEEEKNKKLEEMKKNGQISPDQDLIEHKDVSETKGIRKNTLSMSIDELIDEQINIEVQSQKEQAKKEFKKKKAKKNMKLFNIFTWCLCGVIILAFIVVIIILLVR